MAAASVGAGWEGMDCVVVAEDAEGLVDGGLSAVSFSAILTMSRDIGKGA